MFPSHDHVGDYYATYDGRFFAGKTYTRSSINPLELTKIPPQVSQTSTSITVVGNDSTLAYLKAKGEANINNERVEVPQMRLAQPTEEDYTNTSFTRYFAVKRNQKIYIEIDKDTSRSLATQSPNIDWKNWEAFSIEWKLTNAPIEFVAKQNKEQVLLKNRDYPGFESYIGKHYTKFYK